MKREIFLVFVLLSLGTWMFGAPSISSVVIEPDPLLVGQEFKVKVVGQNISSGVVYIDFRPRIARMLRFSLLVGTEGISAVGTIPADLTFTGEIQCTVRVYAFDSALVQTIATKVVTVKPPVIGSKILFDQPSYSLSADGTLTAQILIQGVPSGQLFSYAIEADLIGPNTTSSTLSLSVPAALNFNGPRAGGALVRTVGDKAYAKGTVDFYTQPNSYYSESLLATLTITGLSAGTYSLALKSYPTLGVTEALFVNSRPETFDSSITYVASSLTVLPAPQSALAAMEGTSVAPATVPSRSAPSTPPSSGATPRIVAPTFFDVPVVALNSGAVTLHFQTVSGLLYAVQYSEDDVNWTTIVPVMPGTGFVVQWTDPTVSEAPHKHYRVVLVESEEGP